MKKIVLLMMVTLSLFAGVKVGDKAIDFKLKTLDGTKSYTLKSFHNRVILLNVWASWCSGCKAEMPEFFHLQKRLGRDFQIVAVSIDKDPNDAKAFLKAVESRVGFKTPFVALSDTKKSTARNYRCVAMPSSYLIDKKGVVRDVIVGSLNAEDIIELESEIKKLERE